MAPIRVGFIGLGKELSSGKAGVWGATAHLPSLLASPHYEIVAVSNTSVASSQASIDAHNLGPSVKAYGDPKDIANDPNVDLVLCAVIVSRHYELIKPALEAGKMAFVEWPLASNMAQNEELVKLAKSKNVKTIVGLQTRADPLVIKIKQLIDEGKIGKVLSSNVTGAIANLPDVWPEYWAAYHLIESGGDTFSIFFGHFLDSFTHVLGNISTSNSILQVVDKEATMESTKDGSHYQFARTSPDEIFVQGKLESGAVAAINFRRIPFGNKTVDNVGVRWVITGTEGEIELTTQEIMWQMDLGGQTFKLRTKSGDVQDIDFKDPDEKPYVSGVNFPGTNSARAWEAFAVGNTDKYPDFESALESHRQLEAIRLESTN